MHIYQCIWIRAPLTVVAFIDHHTCTHLDISIHKYLLIYVHIYAYTSVYIPLILLYIRMYGQFVSLYSCLMHLRNATDPRTTTMMTPLLLTSGLARYEAVLHSGWASPVGGRVLTCHSAHSWQLCSTASPPAT